MLTPRTIKNHRTSGFIGSLQACGSEGKTEPHITSTLPEWVIQKLLLGHRKFPDLRPFVIPMRSAHPTTSKGLESLGYSTSSLWKTNSNRFDLAGIVVQEHKGLEAKHHTVNLGTLAEDARMIDHAS